MYSFYYLKAVLGVMVKNTSLDQKPLPSPLDAAPHSLDLERSSLEPPLSFDDALCLSVDPRLLEIPPQVLYLSVFFRSFLINLDKGSIIELSRAFSCI